MLLGLHHIGIVVKNLDEATKNYMSVLGAQVQSSHVGPKTGSKINFVSVGNATLELVEPSGTESLTAKFLNSHGEGINHICWEVDDINKTLESLSAQGKHVDIEPQEGIIGKVAFISPEGMNSVPIEFVEKRK